MCGSSAGSIPTPVSVTSIRAPSGVARHVDRDRPAARRELDRVGDEVGDDLADPRRVVADPDRRVGQVERQVDAATLGRGRASARPPIRPPRAGRPAAGRAGPARNRASTARAGSGPASRAARSAGRSTRGTRRVPPGRRAAPSVSSSLNVRSAASGVRSSCETSARKSRLRSRSRRMISTLSWSRSAMALNWTASSASSDEPARTSLGGTRRVRSPSARPRDASVRRRSGVVKRRAMRGRHEHADSPSANRAIAASRPGDVGQRGRPEGVRVGQRDLDGVRREDVAGAVGPRSTRDVLLLGLARRRRRLEGESGSASSVRRRRTSCASPSATNRPNVDLDVGLAELVGDEPLQVVVGHRAPGRAGRRGRRRRRPGSPAAYASATPVDVRARPIFARWSRSACCWLVK